MHWIRWTLLDADADDNVGGDVTVTLVSALNDDYRPVADHHLLFWSESPYGTPVAGYSDCSDWQVNRWSFSDGRRVVRRASRRQHLCMRLVNFSGRGRAPATDGCWPTTTSIAKRPSATAQLSCRLSQSFFSLSLVSFAVDFFRLSRRSPACQLANLS